MRAYRTVADCLDALGRGVIVDARDNAVPPSVVAALQRKNGEWVKSIKLQIHAGVRYEGGREIWWFYAQ